MPLSSNEGPSASPAPGTGDIISQIRFSKLAATSSHATPIALTMRSPKTFHPKYRDQKVASPRPDPLLPSRHDPCIPNPVTSED